MGLVFSKSIGISIHAPREGCDPGGSWGTNYNDISIHAPREGCDELMQAFLNRIGRFQSTHPVRGATYRYDALGRRYEISIHAPREGCDDSV